MKPRPEFVARDSRPWRHDQGVTLHGDRRANPARRTTVSNHGDDKKARTSRLVALVAGTYDGPQRRSTPKRWLPELGPQALRIWDAAQDARNRATVRAVYGASLPTPNYPDELAARHVRVWEGTVGAVAVIGAPTSWESVACEILALMDDPQAMSTYYEALRDIAPEYAKAAGHLVSRSATLAESAHPRALRGTTRSSVVDRPKVDGPIPRITRAHHLAATLALEVARFADRGGRTASEAAKARRNAESEAREFEDHAEGQQVHPNGKPPDGLVDYSTWHKLNVIYPDLPVAHSGRCGRSRTATNAGRAPRYLSRMITDPERRLFARTSRGTRALVVVDLSGSMNLEASDIEALLSASVGATVVGYAANTDDRANCQVLAHRGRRVRDVKRLSSGNGVDAPAFVWAVRTYATSVTPVLWVTDCEAVGRSGQTWEILDQCRKVAKHYGARIETDVPNALEALHDLSRGKARPSNPSRYSDVIDAKAHRRGGGSQ